MTTDPHAYSLPSGVHVLSDIGRFGIAPESLLTSEVSDRAVRLFVTFWALYADRDTGEAWPSRARLATDLRCSEDSVDRALAELESARFLRRTPRYNTSGQRSNLYHLYAAPMRTPLGTDAEGSLGTDAAQIQNHSEPDLREDPESSAPQESGPLPDLPAWLGQPDLYRIIRDFEEAFGGEERLLAAILAHLPKAARGTSDPQRRRLLRQALATTIERGRYTAVPYSPPRAEPARRETASPRYPTTPEREARPPAGDSGASGGIPLPPTLEEIIAGGIAPGRPD